MEKNGTWWCISWLWKEVDAKLLAKGQLFWCAIKNHDDHDKYHLQKQLHSEREVSLGCYQCNRWKDDTARSDTFKQPRHCKSKVENGIFSWAMYKDDTAQLRYLQAALFQNPLHHKEKMKCSQGATCRDDTALLWYLQTPQFLCTCSNIHDDQERLYFCIFLWVHWVVLLFAVLESLLPYHNAYLFPFRQKFSPYK